MSSGPASALPAAPQRLPRRQGPAEGLPLHDSALLRRGEAEAARALPPHALMARAGHAVARLGRALAPHARQAWVLAGAGNNGGDGLVAARLLRAAGLPVSVWLAAEPQAGDACWALAQARAAGLAVSAGGPPQPPEGLGPDDLVIDALLGLGLSARRPPEGPVATALAALEGLPAGILAVDLPSGLAADTGSCAGPAVRARWTLSLLGLKPGLWTAAGRDHAGTIWHDDLGVALPATASTPRLLDAPGCAGCWPDRPHTAHKGSQGDLWALGGAAGMSGAIELAARAGLAAGAGRVHVLRLDPTAAPPGHPALMTRAPEALRGEALARATVVAGCGGGAGVGAWLPALIAGAPRLLLDADALNALATDPALAQGLRTRTAPAMLTPHPLEAARLLGCTTEAVQADRLAAARQLAQRYGAMVVLKGSGSVLAAPDGRSAINASGNAALASGGTGDVLAGWIGGLWAQGLDAWDALRLGVWSHGAAADAWQAARGPGQPLDALRLIEALQNLPRG
ncbi:NAD(P)H-hydrate dehydratase [Aquariibacter albus]|uniref:Bifunctional NAD(P)H-hydrate repair enzyme n=1 Tax=Aquariibacter albus TaxID=2759899 RepID=A0A839HFJ7_9BURK|nr:NAD(P)H-hydrate dehydratase [Aquariibacter albus]MBB1160787.1 NAD(P)H-hydrate dehydratase [Aquariibacter albus]